MFISVCHSENKETLFTERRQYFKLHCGSDGSQFYVYDARKLEVDLDNFPNPQPHHKSPIAKPFALLNKITDKLGKMTVNILDLFGEVCYELTQGSST